MSVLDALYAVCDLLLGWTALFGPAGAIVIVGVLSGVAVILFQKYASRQDLLARCKADLKQLKPRIRAAKRAGDAETAKRLLALQGRIGGKYMGAALKPALWTVPIIGIIGLWTGARFAYAPVRPGDEVAVVAHFEDAAAGYAHVVPDAALRTTSPSISAVDVPEGAAGRESRWTVRADAAGDAVLSLRHAGETVRIPFPVGRRAPDAVVLVRSASPGQDRMQAVEIKLRDSVPSAWWNVWLQWGGLYLLAALVVALALRRLLNVQ
jgi:uncharacterized membrane protein (DUF106 family)